MDQVMQESSEDYRHKKFDQGKRPRAEDVLQDLQQLNRERSPLLLNPFFYGVERVSTPFSTDSNCSSDYVRFVSCFNASSTPNSKKRHPLSGGQCGTSSRCEDSGISITPKQQIAANESQPREQLKRLLKPSLLAQSPKKKRKIENVQTGKRNSNSNGLIAVDITPSSNAINVCTNTSAVSTGCTSANKIKKTTLPRKSVGPVNANSIKSVLKPTVAGTLELPTTAAGSTSTNKISKTTLPRKSVGPVNVNSIKSVLKPTVAGTLELPTTAAGSTSTNKISKTTLPRKSVGPVNVNSIKSVLKPTVAGTLELPTTAAHTDSDSSQPLDPSVVLSRIGEDKLRNICTYHTNMVRKFPAKQRSPKDQERRNKNTIACRMSRRFKKLEQIALEEECKELEKQQQTMMEDIMRMTAYLEQLELLMANISISDGEECEIDVVNVDGESDASEAVSILSNNPGAMQRLAQTNNRTSNSSRSSDFSIASLLGNTV